MLAKAILTGGVLSVLAGSIVYFGTEGADATDRATLNEASVTEPIERVDLPSETELAGGTEAEVEVEVEALSETVTPPKSEETPKTRWLDQYLKATKPDTEDKAEPAPEVSPSVETEMTTQQVVIEVDDETGTVLETDEIDIEITESLDVKVLEEIMKTHKGSKTKIRVMKFDNMPKSEPETMMPALMPFDYAAVLTEAKKLQVIDMRDQAVLEIVDFAIDRGDIGQAADFVQELSSSEVRDSARGRIGKGLASCGDMDAAFAVLDEIEIDELVAPIRLDIIAALMATRAERGTHQHRHIR